MVTSVKMSKILDFEKISYIISDATSKQYMDIKPLSFSRSLATSLGVYLIDFLLSIQSLYLYAGVAAGVRRDDLPLLKPLSRLLQHNQHEILLIHLKKSQVLLMHNGNMLTKTFNNCISADLGRDPFVELVPVSVSVKLPASQVKLKPNSRIRWNRPQSQFRCRNRKKDGRFREVGNGGGVLSSLI